MPQPISDYSVGDTYAPTVVKPSLQQYDNYQIYTLYCSDFSTVEKFKSFIAVQKYSPFPIYFDFSVLASKYR